MVDEQDDHLIVQVLVVIIEDVHVHANETDDEILMLVVPELDYEVHDEDEELDNHEQRLIILVVNEGQDEDE